MLVDPARLRRPFLFLLYYSGAGTRPLQHQEKEQLRINAGQWLINVIPDPAWQSASRPDLSVSVRTSEFPRGGRGQGRNKGSRVET
jgi:hypothetical protein